MNGLLRYPCEAAGTLKEVGSTPCPKESRRWVLVAAILGSTMATLDGTVVNIALPVIQFKLNATAAQAQGVMEAYLLFLSSLLLFGGSLGDRFGRRRVFAGGAVLFALASAACGAAGSITLLIVARAVQGVGGALLVPGSLSLISASFPPEERGRAIGTWSAFTALAAALGPVAGGFLVERFSWRSIFFINLPIAAAVALIAVRWVPKTSESASRHLDSAGAALVTLSLGGIVLGLIKASTLGFRDSTVLASGSLGVLAGAGFLAVERRSRDPMLPFQLFRSRAFVGANLITLLLYGALGAALFQLPFHLIQVRHYSPSAAGAALLPLVALIFLLSRWTGGLVHRFGARLPLVVGPALAAAGLALFLPLRTSGGYWETIFPPVALLGLGMALTVAPLTTAVMTSEEDRFAGVVSGVNNTVARAAGLIAIAVLSLVAARVFAHSLDRRMEGLPVTSSTERILRDAKLRLSAAAPDSGAAGGGNAAVDAAIEQAGISSFRAVMGLAAALALAASGAAALWIPHKQRG